MTSVEYGVVAFALAVAITAAVAQTGTSIGVVVADISRAMNGPPDAPPPDSNSPPPSGE
ncbi:MAG: hypothetical protein WCH83_04840 [Alphaproteobacteria bacterium]